MSGFQGFHDSGDTGFAGVEIRVMVGNLQINFLLSTVVCRGNLLEMSKLSFGEARGVVGSHAIVGFINSTKPEDESNALLPLPKKNFITPFLEYDRCRSTGNSDFFVSFQ